MTVQHSAGSYEISFCRLSEAISALPQHSFIITDSNVNRIYRSQLPTHAQVLVVPPGEPSKCVESWSQLQSSLSSINAKRSSTVVAFGGGVIGDLAGFVAATYMRGVGLVQIPTTLLSQVDSSVGGKVGIDLPEGKNLVGAFYPPKQVFICDDTLDTLPKREYDNGMAEVWKYGFILDASLIDDLRFGTGRSPDLVRRCIELKKEIVEGDEFETKGLRAKLNFGHTIGHAIEHLVGYGKILHGEAISIGMVAEAALSEAIGMAASGTRAVVEDCLRSQGLPVTSVVLRNVDMLIETMRRDKKAGSDGLAFSLLTGIGACRLVPDLPESEVRGVLATL